MLSCVRARFLLLADSRAAADKYIWQADLNGRKRKEFRGRAKVTVDDLQAELATKKEIVDRMTHSLDAFKNRNKDEFHLTPIIL